MELIRILRGSTVGSWFGSSGVPLWGAEIHEIQILRGGGGGGGGGELIQILRGSTVGS